MQSIYCCCERALLFTVFTPNRIHWTQAVAENVLHKLFKWYRVSIAASCDHKTDEIFALKMLFISASVYLIVSVHYIHRKSIEMVLYLSCILNGRKFSLIHQLSRHKWSKFLVSILLWTIADWLRWLVYPPFNRLHFRLVHTHIRFNALICITEEEEEEVREKKLCQFRDCHLLLSTFNSLKNQYIVSFIACIAQFLSRRNISVHTYCLRAVCVSQAVAIGWKERTK